MIDPFAPEHLRIARKAEGSEEERAAVLKAAYDQALAA